MSLVHNRPKCGPTHFFVKINTLEISSPRNWATFIFFRKLLKENNRTIGENSPNLVTLFQLGFLVLCLVDWDVLITP
jgi:hypothetical protein